MDKRINERLKSIVGEGNVVAEPSVLRSYLEVVNDDNIGRRIRENEFAVVKPSSTSQVVELVRLAVKEKIAIIPRGAGTSREGAALPLGSAVVLDFSLMSRVLNIDEEDCLVVAEPGIPLEMLEVKLGEWGLRLGHGPDHATLGGAIATNSLGQRSSRHGDMRNFVADLEVVLGDGGVIHTGRSVWRNNTGYDLTQLFVGSEGTLGVITSATLRVGPKPEWTAKRMYAFEGSLEDAVGVAREVENAFQPVSNRADDHARNDGKVCTVRVSFEGKKEAAERQVRLCDDLIRKGGGEPVPDDFAEEFIRRRSVKAFEMGVRPKDERSVPEEPGIRFSDWKRSLEKWKGLCAERGITYAGCQLNVSYPGVVTFYSTYPTGRPELVEAYRELMEEFYSYVISIGGTFSATHGVGNRMNRFMAAQYPPRNLKLMAGLKDLFDPGHVLNPGKVLP
ncbi:MAG: FAD-binding oxidoreductase [Thaumarchaeota archaeon]|nr:FAD-binding oxidoreductase [Nitrososphaerota archaeon]